MLVDGVYNVDPKLNAIGPRPPVDAIREFEVLASTYDASLKERRSAGERRTQIGQQQVSRDCI
jgi:hypothetical protein